MTEYALRVGYFVGVGCTLAIMVAGLGGCLDSAAAVQHCQQFELTADGVPYVVENGLARRLHGAELDTFEAVCR